VVSRGHIRRRGDAWELRVSAGTDPATGRRRLVSRTVHGTQRQAERALTRLLTEVDDGAHLGPDVTVAVLLERWQEVKAQRWSPKTAKETAGYVRRHLVPAIGRLRLSELTTARLDALNVQLLASHAPATVRRIHGIMHAALEQAVRWTWLTRNPASYCEPITGRPAEVAPPPPGDVARLLDTLTATFPALALLVRLAAVTGRRRGELCALRWTDFDLDAGAVLVTRTLVDSISDGWVERPISKNPRRQPPLAIDAGTVAELLAHRDRTAEHLASIGLGLAGDGHVFVRVARHELRPWSPDSVSRWFADARHAAGLDRVRLHDLRHYVASVLLGEGVALTTVAGRLGHRGGGRTTQEVYAHLMLAPDRAAADLLGRMLDG
jgi:integrase